MYCKSLEMQYPNIKIGLNSSNTDFYEQRCCICIGNDSKVPDQGNGHVCIGSDEFRDSSIKICDVDIRKLVKEVQDLKQVIAEQQQMIETLWYAPEMPGYNEGKEDWDKNHK